MNSTISRKLGAGFAGFLYGFYALILIAHAEDSYSPYADQSYPTNVYFGDTHLHTNLSLDANSLGNKHLGPDGAYRFAKGETVVSSTGKRARLHRPLDFLVVADHASNMGIVKALVDGDPNLLTSNWGKRAVTAWNEKRLNLFYDGVVGDKSYRTSIWESVAQSADKHNDPGKFTALIGYEWTQLFYNLHRVVIYKDSAVKVSSFLPFSQYDSDDPEDLWAYLDRYERETGGEVLAIPHNSNWSMGVMFALEDAKGQPFSTSYAKTRIRWEPLLEVTQIKGDSETHPVLSPDDEFSDFERMSREPFPHQALREKRNYTGYDAWIRKNHKDNNDTRWMRTYEYGRSALKLGLSQQAKLGVNPFKFGMIGSTDSHTSLSAVDENNFWGKFAVDEPSGKRLIKPLVWSSELLNWEPSAAGYAAVWATENTREALFAAMKRKEVYATTGPRMTVRFFGGWDYEKNDALKPDLAAIGYEKGVPMGSDLTHAPKGKSPQFLIHAVKDPDGANLDRVQVIKGWHDKNGELHEKIHNVALSDKRKENWRGKVKPVGNTVDIKDASYTNTIGNSELAVVWTDPDFNRSELAFYYVRVLEIPTPRWTAYDAKYFDLKDIPEEVPMETQERAYTSPIWYTPEGQ